MDRWFLAPYVQCSVAWIEATRLECRPRRRGDKIRDRQTDRQTRRGLQFHTNARVGRRDRDETHARERKKKKRLDSELKTHDVIRYLTIPLDERGRLKYMIVVPTSASIGNRKDQKV
jgi:hypothetical protein